MSLLYFWEFDIDPSKANAFKDTFAKISHYNEGFPRGTAFIGVYETFIGQGAEPKMQVFFVTPSMTAFDQSANAAGLQAFHRDLTPFLRPNSVVRNRLLKALGDTVNNGRPPESAQPDYDGDNPWAAIAQQEI